MANAGSSFQGVPYNSDNLNETIDDNVNVHDESGRAVNSEPCKRKVESDENNNRFNAVSKRFKAAEFCDQEIDHVLASIINELFRNGIDKIKYNGFIMQ